MDPTPTEAEVREAEEWYKGEWPRRNKDADSWRTVEYTIEAAEHREDCCAAYAAALAKCRVDADKIRADERERCAKIVENLDDFPDLHAGQMRFGLRCGLEDREIGCPYEAAEYGFEDATERCLEWAKNTAAAIRGGAE